MHSIYSHRPGGAKLLKNGNFWAIPMGNFGANASLAVLGDPASPSVGSAQSPGALGSFSHHCWCFELLKKSPDCCFWMSWRRIFLLHSESAKDPGEGSGWKGNGPGLVLCSCWQESVRAAWDVLQQIGILIACKSHCSLLQTNPAAAFSRGFPSPGPGGWGRWESRIGMFGCV